MRTVNTHELKNGDVIRDFGVTMRLKERTLHTNPHATAYDPKGTVTFKTDILEVPEHSAIPKHWLLDWIVQGNGNARWVVI